MYGEIKAITKTGTAIDYNYDAGGNRTSKKVTVGAGVTTSFYVRYAQGNTLAIYTKKNTEDIKWNEQHLYGSSRLGLWNWDTIVPPAPPVVGSNNFIYDSLLCGSRVFELSNHLHNVLVTVSDKKLGVDIDIDGTVDYYEAEVILRNILLIF